MNLYIRYFDEECVVTTVEEAYAFLSSLPGIALDEYFQRDLQQYLESNTPYPKRYKVRPRVYFIVIKTTATTLEEFKQHGAKQQAMPPRPEVPRDVSLNKMNEEKPGWYEAEILFKRVASIPGTNKFQYRDTRFRARLKARSGQDCYNRLVEHLRGRQDVDPRSQFPSMRGKNFSYLYMGTTLPADLK